MIKCKLKCDKQYGGKYPLVDCGDVSHSLLHDMIERFTVEGVLYVTEDVVDYYNRHHPFRTHSFKSANAIITNLRKQIKAQN